MNKSAIGSRAVPWRHVEGQRPRGVHKSHARRRLPGYGSRGGVAGRVEITRLAEMSGMDPVAFRNKTCCAAARITAPRRYTHGRRRAENLSVVERAIGWDGTARPGAAAASRFASRMRGTHSVTAAVVRLHSTGPPPCTLHIELGQGPGRFLPRSRPRRWRSHSSGVRVDEPDPTTPLTSGTSGSRSTTLTGSAVLAAARDVRGQLIAIAKKRFEAPWT